MKNIYTYLAAAFFSLLALSCAKERQDILPSGEDGDVLRLELSAVSPRTKATTPGVDPDFHENTLATLDWFIYKEEAGTTVLKHGRALAKDLKDKTVEEGETPVKTYSIPVEETDTQIESGETYYLYVIANLPSSVTISGNESVAALQQLVLNNDFTESPKQASFVMDNLSAQAFEAGSNPVPVQLTRLAAKVTMTVNVVSQVKVGDAVFTPILGSMAVNMVYTNGSSTLEAVPAAYDSETFSIYDYYEMEGKGLTQREGTRTVTTTRFYHKELNGTKYYYKEVEEDSSVTYTEMEEKPVSDVDASSPEYIKVTTTSVYSVVDTDPFYTYPSKWNYSGGGDARQPYLKIKLPWLRNEANNKNYFYKILIPGAQKDGIEYLERNHWYHIDLNVAILGNEFDEGSVKVEGTTWVFDWGDTSADFSGIDLGDLKGQYLYIPQKVYTIYSIDDLTVPVVSSHPLNEKVTVEKVTKNIYTAYEPKNPATVTAEYTGSKAAAGVFEVKAQGKDKLLFHNRLTTLADEGSAGINMKDLDVSPITFTLTVSNTAGLTASVQVVQIPPIVIENKHNSGQNSGRGYVYVNGYSDGRDHGYGTAGYSANADGDNANPNMYVIEASLIPSALGWTIGDPRKTSVDNLGNDWSVNTGDYYNPRRLTWYHPADNSDDAKSVIAPKFRIASSHGLISASINDFLSFDEARKRCASYQEDGYPAGRWRVPTQAEIRFMIKLSNVGVIPSLFSERGKTGTYRFLGYFTADGGMIIPRTDKTIDYYDRSVIGTSGNPSDNGGVRCVYDEWYWGSAQGTKNSFTWGDRELF